VKAPVALVVLAAALVVAAPALPARAATCPIQSACGGSDNVHKTLYATYNSDTDSVEVREHRAYAHEDGPGALPRYAYTTVPACMHYNDPNSGFNDALCMGATANPLCRKGEIYVEIWRREVAPADDPIWHFTGDSTCIGSHVVRTIPRAQLTGDVRDELAKHVPAPDPRVDPSGTTLVGMPVIVSTTPQPAVTLQVPGIPGSTVSASPTYSWDFAGEATAEGAGRPYDGTDPLADPGHYVAHPFAAAGTKTVTLDVVWHAVFHVDGVDLDLAPITFSANAQVPVRQAAARLVAGG
jgi:hypothetical protein